MTRYPVHAISRETTARRNTEAALPLLNEILRLRRALGDIRWMAGSIDEAKAIASKALVVVTPED